MYSEGNKMYRNNVGQGWSAKWENGKLTLGTTKPFTLEELEEIVAWVKTKPMKYRIKTTFNSRPEKVVFSATFLPIEDEDLEFISE